MALKDVGFGGTSTSTYQNLTTLIREFAPRKAEVQIQQQSDLIGSGYLEETTDGVDEYGDYVVPLEEGNRQSVQWIRDKGRLPTPEAVIPTKARFTPAYLVGNVSMGIGAAETKSPGPTQVRKLSRDMDSVMKQLAQFLARGIHDVGVNPQAGTTWSGTGADSTATVNFLDISLFQPGSAYDFIDLSSGFAYVVQCTAKTPAAVGANSEDVAGSVSFINNVPNPATGSVVALTDTTIATGDSFRPRGYTAGFGAANTALGVHCVGFDDIAGSGASSSLGGITPGIYSSTTHPQWIGRYRNFNGVYSQEAVVKAFAGLKQFSGEYPDVAVMSPIVAAAHAMATGFHGAVFGVTAGVSAARPQSVDRTMDKFGTSAKSKTGMKVGGADIIQDSNMPAARMVAYAKDMLRLVWFKKIGADEEGGDAVLLGRTFFDRGAQISGGCQLVPHKRCAVFVGDNFTSL